MHPRVDQNLGDGVAEAVTIENAEQPINRGRRVLLASGAGKLTLSSPVDFTVRDGAGSVHDVVAGTYTLTPALKLKVDAAPKAQALVPPLLFQPGSEPLSPPGRERRSSDRRG